MGDFIQSYYRATIKDMHEQDHHGGTNQVLADLSAHYWIISVREAIKEWEEIVCIAKEERPLQPKT